MYNGLTIEMKKLEESAMGREFELKFAATALDHEALRARFGNLSPITMETTYYDTPAGDIRRLHWTLRSRWCSHSVYTVTQHRFRIRSWRVRCSFLRILLQHCWRKSILINPL